jgi:putative acetyltransferase
MKIVVDDLQGPQIAALLEEHLVEMRSITPLESKHALDLDSLRAPGITFWTVWDDDQLVGCGAIKELDAEHAELKSMRTARARQGGGVGSALLTHIVAQAQSMGFTRMSLETGSAEFFEPARRLYRKFGFELCEPFADYQLDPHSVFMTRTI